MKYHDSAYHLLRWNISLGSPVIPVFLSMISEKVVLLISSTTTRGYADSYQNRSPSLKFLKVWPTINDPSSPKTPPSIGSSEIMASNRPIFYGLSL